MNFTKVVGPHLGTEEKTEAARKHLSSVFTELSLSYGNKSLGTGLGGDPFVFQLIFPIMHIADYTMPTAATDGRRFYWNPDFMLGLSKIGVRIVIAHEAWHAIYMHPQRRGIRIPKLWNIAVDYIVNNMIMQDLKQRGFDPVALFTKNLGKFLTLDEYQDWLKNPEKAPSKLKKKGDKCFYAQVELPDGLKRPEQIYDLLFKLIPRCPECNRLGVWPKKKDKKKDDQGKEEDKGDKGDKGKDGDKGNKGKKKGKSDDHSHGDNGEPCDHNHEGKGQKEEGEGKGEGKGKDDCDHGCGNCSGEGFDPFGFGDTLDDHMDSEESEEQLGRRIADAAEQAKRMAGHVPAGLEDEIGSLLAPKLAWQDFIRGRILKARDGNSKNNWSQFRIRPMFGGMLVPKRIDVFAKFICLLDTSGSMSPDDMAYGLSQLQSLDERSEGIIVPADADIYWDKSTKIKKANREELSKVKIVGRGGTMFSSFFTDYEKKIGKADFLVMITDGYLIDSDVAAMVQPSVDVIWLITSAYAFKAPFGRVFELRNDIG